MEEGEGREKEGLGKTTELNDLLKSLKTNKYDCEIQMNSKKKKKNYIETLSFDSLLCIKMAINGQRIYHG